MTAGSYLAGVGMLSALLAIVGYSAWRLVRGLVPELTDAPLAVGLGSVATGLLILAHLIPGALGILTRGTVLASALALLGLSLAAVRRWGGRPVARPFGRLPDWPQAGDPSAAIAAAAVVTVVVLVVAYLRLALPVPTEGTDALSFHLPGVASWIQSGSLWGIDQFVPSQAQAYYPNNGDLMLLATILPWHDAAFARLAGLPFLLMMGGAIYACSVELGAARPVAVSVAAAFVSIPVVLAPPLEDLMPDPVLLATLAAGVLFGLRAVRTLAASDVCLAGISLGIALGTKWYGVSSVGVLLVLAAIVLLASRAERRERGRSLAIVFGLVLLFGGFWFVRNLVGSGNPLFPVKVAPFGVTIFDAPADPIRERAGFAIAHYLGDPDVLGVYILPALSRTIRAAGGLLALAVPLTLGAALLRRRRSGPQSGGPDRRPVFLAIAAAALAVVYVLTPYSALGPAGRPIQADANTRYLLPALVLAAPALAVWATSAKRWTVILQIALLAAVIDALANGPPVGVVPLLEAAGAVALVAAAAWLLRGERWRRLAAVGAVAAALALVAGGYLTQRSFNSASYPGADHALKALLARAPGGQRVGITGVWSASPPVPVLPAFGRRLSNRVSYLGPVVDHMLRRYRSCDAFAARLHSSAVGELLVARGFVPPRPVPEARWARSLGLPEVARSTRFLLFDAEAAPALKSLRTATRRCR